MRNFIIVSIIGLFLGLGAECQAQGFAGKRFLVGYNFATFHDFDANVYLAEFRGYKEFPLTKTHAFEAHYIANRRTMIGASLSKFRADRGGTWTTTNGQVIYPQIFNTTLGIHLKTYFLQRGAIAPIGTYFTMRLDRHFGFLKAYEDPDIFQKGQLLGARLGMGRYSVIYERLLLNFEFEGGWVMGQGKVTSTHLLSRNSYLSWIRTSEYFRLNFKLGLAFLL